MSAVYVWTVILGMALTNYVLRAGPFLALARVELPAWLKRWLDYVPVSVMAALVVAEVLHPSGTWLVPWRNPYLWASFGTGVVYWRWRSLIGATLAGIALFVAVRWLLGFVPF
jgi:branched-subunit amino acid transport protein